MATLKCPYCDNEFDLTDFKGERRVECPMCGRSLRVVRRKGKAGTKAEVQPQSTTAWGTEGFRSSTRRSWIAAAPPLWCPPCPSCAPRAESGCT
ncbi:MAG: hypothetical protein R6X33_18885, partial [Candidatus Brocadiia bacterium]